MTEPLSKILDKTEPPMSTGQPTLVELIEAYEQAIKLPCVTTANEYGLALIELREIENVLMRKLFDDGLHEGVNHRGKNYRSERDARVHVYPVPREANDIDKEQGNADACGIDRGPRSISVRG